jgi:hypothetical protein
MSPILGPSKSAKFSCWQTPLVIGSSSADCDWEGVAGRAGLLSPLIGMNIAVKIKNSAAVIVAGLLLLMNDIVAPFARFNS